MTVNPTAYRAVMSRLATGVTVLATRDGERHEVMTANSVMSVSLDPVLLVVSVSAGGRWGAAARRTGRFTVNVLSERQEQLSRWCSDRRRHREPEALADHPTQLTAEGLLVFSEALATFDCILHEVHSVGDHDLLVGRVEDMCVGDSGAPLLYFGSSYAALIAQPVEHRVHALAPTG